MPRFFNILEAEGLLPEVQRLVRGLLEYKSEFEEAADELQPDCSAHYDHGRHGSSARRCFAAEKPKNAAVRATRGAVDQLRNTGCQLKNLETGLVDFPTLYRGQEVYLSGKSARMASDSGTIWTMEIPGARPSTANS